MTRASFKKYLFSTALFPVVFALAAPAVISLYQLVFAVDTIQTSAYQDTNTDGTVDRIQWLLDEDVLSCTFEAGDWSIDFAGDINVTAITGVSCSGTDGVININVTADSNITGGLTGPMISYSNQGTLDNILLVSGSMSDKLAVNVTDNAAPSLLAVATYPQYLDTNSDGTVDLTSFFFTEPVDYTYDDTDWTTTANDLTGYDVVECNSCISANPLELLTTANAGKTGVSGGTEPTIAYNFLGNPIFDSVGNALTSFGPVSLYDNAAPTLFSAMYLDANANGTVDTVRTTWSENVSMSGSTVDDWNIDPGVKNLVFASAPNDATEGLTLDILVTADANETGGTASDINYDNDDANNSVVDSPLAAGTTLAVAMMDGSSPSVISWSLDLTNETLTLNFTESVDASTLVATGITIQDAATATQSVTLTGGSTASVDGATIVVDLLTADVTSIMNNGSLATTTANTYLRITSAVIDDLAALNVNALADGSALQVSALTVPAAGGSRQRSERIASENAEPTASDEDHAAAPEDSEPSAEESSPAPSAVSFEDIEVDQKYLKRRAALKMVARVLGVSVDELEERGVVKGHIHKNKYEKRADFVALVLKANGIDIVALPACEAQTYSDIEKSKWYCPVLAYARNQGWITEASGTFSPSGKVTKSWASEILSRAFAR